MATSTPPSPPHAAAGSRRPFFIRWWYDPVQRRRAIIATVLALLYGSGLVYGSWTRVCSGEDRKSTRLNSSHSQNTYAVFCLEKKNRTLLKVDRLVGQRSVHKRLLPAIRV